jgi:hypothetical protein
VTRFDRPSHYNIRPMTTALISDAWLRWLSNPEIMEQINAVPHRMKRKDLESYVVAMQARKIGLVGVFRNEDKNHVGLYEIQFERVHRLANLSFMADQETCDVSEVFIATETALLEVLRSQFGCEKAAMVLPESYTRLRPAFAACGWDEEGVLRQEFASASGAQKRLDGICFGKKIAINS